jgi:hypothetical protein
MIHGLDTGFLVAAEVREHAEHAGARVTLTQVLSARDGIAIAPHQPVRHPGFRYLYLHRAQGKGHESLNVLGMPASRCGAPAGAGEANT